MKEKARKVVNLMYNDPLSQWLGAERLKVEPGTASAHEIRRECSMALPLPTAASPSALFVRQRIRIRLQFPRGTP